MRVEIACSASRAIVGPRNLRHPRIDVTTCIAPSFVRELENLEEKSYAYCLRHCHLGAQRVHHRGGAATARRGHDAAAGNHRPRAGQAGRGCARRQLRRSRAVTGLITLCLLLLCSFG